MIHSYNKNNSEYDFFGLKSDKKKKSEGDAYPYRAILNYDSAPSLLGRIPSSDDSPSLFAPQSEGERIRKTLQSAVDKALGKGKYSGIFDGIDYRKIEENIPLAESVIKKNKQKNAYSVEDTKNLPYLRDGMAAFYALSESGNYKAANAARKIAYTPLAQTGKKQETQSKTPDFFEKSLKDSKDDTEFSSFKTFETSKNTDKVRYAGEDKIRFYTDATNKSPNVDLLSLGDEMIYLGEKKKADGVEWAKVEYNGKTGWVKSKYLKTQKSAVNGDAFSYLTNELTETDINAGLKVVEKDNKFYYDYTDVIMNRMNTVLPEFDSQRVISYEDYVDKFTPKIFGKYSFGQPPAIDEYYATVMNKLLFFYNQVTHGAPWDIKVDSSWQTQFGDIRMPYYDGTEDNNEKFLFRGELVTREELGNITYGYLGSAMGLGEKTLYWGAGVANDWKKGIFQGKAYDEENFYGDKKEDFESVTKGIQMYYEDYPETKPGIIDARVIAAKQYIDRNVLKNISCEDIAKQCYISSRHLNRLFIEQEHLSVKQYIIARKITEIEKMLKNSDMTVKEIGDYFGFCNEFYFNSFFKKNVGISPGEYRKSTE